MLVSLQKLGNAMRHILFVSKSILATTNIPKKLVSYNLLFKTIQIHFWILSHISYDTLCMDDKPYIKEIYFRILNRSTGPILLPKTVVSNIKKKF